MKRLFRWLVSPDYSNGRVVLTAIALFTIAAYLLMFLNQAVASFMTPNVALLTDPFLQSPTTNAVRVVWFTEFAGTQHQVEYGQELQQRSIATTTQLSRTREDQESWVGDQTEDNKIYEKPVMRPVWRHEAEVTGLTPGSRVPYRVASLTDQGNLAQSEVFSLAPLPDVGRPLKILLTSDHQLMPMTAANLEKVVETVGQVDGVFLAGDLVNIADRASEWFDDNRGGAFFPCLQGRAAFKLERGGTTTVYRGGAIIQNAPLYPTTGNHEVMGRFSMETGLGKQFNDPQPKAIANQRYALNAKQVNPANDADVQTAWSKNNSFNTDTFSEIFNLPTHSSGTENYYAVSFGDVRLVSLYVTNIWRVPSLNPDAKGRFRERDEDLNYPDRWGYGQHIFEPISVGSAQHNWLKAELASPEFQQAKYKVVMFHHPPHSLGDNIVPAYTNPVQMFDYDAAGQIQAVLYEYPLKDDYLIQDVVPLLEAAGVQLVFYGHSHLWNRFVSPTGLHFLESSNVGNTYGAYLGEKRRQIPINFNEQYVPVGDPNSLEPIVPSIAPLIDDKGQPQPYIASNDITAFSIFDTGTGVISSYYFDTRQPRSTVVKFDEFQLEPR